MILSQVIALSVSIPLVLANKAPEDSSALNKLYYDLVWEGATFKHDYCFVCQALCLRIGTPADDDENKQKILQVDEDYDTPYDWFRMELNEIRREQHGNMPIPKTQCPDLCTALTKGHWLDLLRGIAQGSDREVKLYIPPDASANMGRTTAQRFIDFIQTDDILFRCDSPGDVERAKETPEADIFNDARLYMLAKLLKCLPDDDDDDDDDWDDDWDDDDD